jgi:two-component system chemotaxis sensor kinase CheA
VPVDINDEIVQDFLLEAGEILERLNGQLVDLEQQPDDKDLLNSVFRNFHTIKGGAGFLALGNLVDVCHKAEDIFNLLRQGARRVDAELMDCMLPVLDTVNSMFEEIRAGEDPSPADPELLAALAILAEGGSTAAQAGAGTTAEAAPPSPEPLSSEAPPADGDEINVEEYEQLLAAVSGDQTAEGAGSAPEAAEAGDEISEDEFDALLDQLHGAGKHGARTAQSAAEPVETPGDEITEEEFDALLDKLHGAGKGPGDPQQDRNTAAVPAKPPAAVESKSAAPPADTTVRVETSILDLIMNMVGELVLVRNRLSTLEPGIGDEDVSKTISTLDVVTSDLQMAAMKTRMQPIKKVFGRFPRVVRDLARSLEKEVRLEMVGEDTDLDKNLVEALADPLVHLVRNSVDHGIEMPDEREAAGKPRTGTVKLSAEQEGEHILLCITDDGKGMDADLLRQKAVEKRLMDSDAAARLDDKDCFDLIFAPGFSTKAEISDVSGRGVGMDVVKTRINQLNGIIEIDSTVGGGTRIAIKVPLTLAILPTLMINLGAQVFALPLVNVDEILDIDLGQTKVVDGQKTLVVRGKALPLFYLGEWLVRSCDGFERPRGHVVIVSVGTVKVGLLVDHLLGQEEVVIKPLGAFLQGTQGLAGATITGDGNIALILDLPGLISAYARRY